MAAITGVAKTDVVREGNQGQEVAGAMYLLGESGIDVRPQANDRRRFCIRSRRLRWRTRLKRVDAAVLQFGQVRALRLSILLENQIAL